MDLSLTAQLITRKYSIVWLFLASSEVSFKISMQHQTLRLYFFLYRTPDFIILFVLLHTKASKFNASFFIKRNSSVPESGSSLVLIVLILFYFPCKNSPPLYLLYYEGRYFQ